MPTCLCALFDSALLTSHEDIVTTVQHLKRPTLSRETISQRVKQHFSGSRNMDPHKQDQLLLTAIDLCLSLWLMIRIGRSINRFLGVDSHLAESIPPWRTPRRTIPHSSSHHGPSKLLPKAAHSRESFQCQEPRQNSWHRHILDGQPGRDHLLLKERKDRQFHFIHLPQRLFSAVPQELVCRL